ncbi:MAG: hypothetical protein AAGF12_38605 [Myxococcota bacterium]
MKSQPTCQVRKLVLTAGLLLGSLLSGCPTGTSLSETCTAVGDQCRIRDGLLGVCTPKDPPDCPDPPCLQCVGQH